VLLKRVGLDHRLDHKPGQLTGGEKQRAAVVRALICKPRILLADEPTGALDRKSSENLAQLLMELNHEEGLTLMTVTHSMELARLTGTVLELEDGHLQTNRAS
jgi:lipoprotein-releasing system ATP-binding protein